MAGSIRALIAIACLAYAFWNVDLAAFVASITSFSPFGLLFVLCVSCGSYFLLGYRLSRIIPDRPGVIPCCIASVFGLGVNNLIPARLGEIAKVLYLKQKCGIPAARLLGVVFWERFADVHALLLLSILLFIVMNLSRALLPMLGLVVALWAFIIFLRGWPAPARTLIAFIPYRSFRQLLLDIHEYLREGLSGRVTGILAAVTAALWASYAFQVIYMLIRVAGLGLSVPQAGVVFLVTALTMAVPVTPGALGVYEAVVVLSLGWYGIPRDEALAIAVTMHMIQYIPVTLFAVAVLSRMHLSLSAITGKA